MTSDEFEAKAAYWQSQIETMLIEFSGITNDQGLLVLSPDPMPIIKEFENAVEFLRNNRNHGHFYIMTDSISAEDNSA